MDFRIVSITEKGRSLGRKLQLQLENIQGPNEASSTAPYEPVGTIFAVVPYTSEFWNLTIGQVLRLGAPQWQAIAGTSLTPEAVNNSVGDAPPTVFADAAARRVLPNPNFGKPIQFFSYNLEPKAGEAPLSIAPDAATNQLEAALKTPWTSGPVPAFVEPGYKFSGSDAPVSPAEASYVLSLAGFKSNTTWSDAGGKLRKELAREEMKKALPIVLELMKNPTLVNKLGYRVDAAEILRASGDLQPSWKFHQEIKAQPKQSELVEASTIFLCEPTEPYYMVDFKKYPESYVENLVREDQKRKAKLEYDLEIQKQTFKAIAEMNKARAEFAKSDKVDPRFSIWQKNENKQ